MATKIWGDYRYTPERYVEWLRSFSPSWAATMDYCCEPEIARDEDAICRRQEKTTEMARLFWRDYRDVPWAWVPTVQGWSVEDYRAHARQLRPLLEEMTAYYGPGSAFRVGIGTLCQRADSGMIRRISRAVAEELPAGLPLHLWGVKLGALAGREALPETIVSVDSAAWNWDAWTLSRQEGGISQRRYAYERLLPAYRRKVQRALSGVKQRVLF